MRRSNSASDKLQAGPLRIDARHRFRLNGRMHTTRWISVLASILGTALIARADVKLPALFTDNMVLQRDVNAPIWGWADDGEQITIEINGKKVQATGKDGKFQAKLPKLKASSEP